MQDFLNQLHQRLEPMREGTLAAYIPQLAAVDPERFGISVATVDGRFFEVGDFGHTFTLQSTSKPLVYGLAMETVDPEALHERVNVEPSGDPFNSIVKLDDTARPHNPLINTGAIAVADLIRGDGPEDRFAKIAAALSGYFGRPIEVDEEVFASERRTGDRNRAIAHLLRQFGRLDGPLDESLELYFRQCSVRVSAHDLALAGATLAHAGMNPVTEQQVISDHHVSSVLSLMLSCGMYDYSGHWAYRVGLPAKSGVGGGICVVVPGVMGIGVFSPRLDQRGNSVRGVAAVEAISRHYGLHIFGRDSRCAALDDVLQLRG